MSDYGKYGDDILVGLCTRGDGRAMKVIYDRYVEYLSAVCARYISGDDDRKDVLQESFVRIFTSLDKFCFRGEGSLKAWMIRIVVNESLRFLKKTRRMILSITTQKYQMCQKSRKLMAFLMML